MDVPPIPGCHGTLEPGLVDNRLPTMGPVWHNELCMEDSDNEIDADWPFPTVTRYGKVCVNAMDIPYPNHWCKEDIQDVFRRTGCHVVMKSERIDTGSAGEGEPALPAQYSSRQIQVSQHPQHQPAHHP